MTTSTGMVMPGDLPHVVRQRVEARGKDLQGGLEGLRDGDLEIMVRDELQKVRTEYPVAARAFFLANGSFLRSTGAFREELVQKVKAKVIFYLRANQMAHLPGLLEILRRAKADGVVDTAASKVREAKLPYSQEEVGNLINQFDDFERFVTGMGSHVLFGRCFYVAPAFLDERVRMLQGANMEVWDRLRQGKPLDEGCEIVEFTAEDREALAREEDEGCEIVEFTAEDREALAQEERDQAVTIGYNVSNVS